MECLYAIDSNPVDEMALGDRVRELEKKVRRMEDRSSDFVPDQAPTAPIPAPVESIPGPRRTLSRWDWAVRIAAPAGLVIAVLAWLQPEWAKHSEHDLESNVDRLIDVKLEKPLDRLGKVETGIAVVGAKIDTLIALQKQAVALIPDIKTKLPEGLARASTGDTTSLGALAYYVSAGTAQRVPVPDSLVQKSGLNLIALRSDEAEKAWQVVLQLLAYRSALNAISPTESRQLSLAIRPHDPKKGETIDLSDSSLSHSVILVNWPVYYDGSAAIHLEKTGFNDCDFYMPRTANSEKLATAILQQRLVTLSLPALREVQ